MARREWLIERRAGRTQQDISVSADISRSVYASIETGDRNPSVKTAKKIADVLGFSWTLFFDSECPESEQLRAI